ncbi:endonuclease-reverse transcriptase [Trichonephila clavipes]|nr:endonuclease-reverse transcriptase [Trichonephila clavipes]
MKVSVLLDCSTVSSEEFIEVDGDNLCTAPIVTEKDILKFVQCSRNVIDADSDDENEVNNVAPVSTSPEVGSIMKNQGCWRTRHNFELYRLYKESQVAQVVQSNRLRWLGHIWRSHENNQTRAYTFKNPMGSRTRGRSPTRWIDDVKNDLKTLNIKNWQRVAAYLWNWRKRAVVAAKTCNRLLRL